MQTLYLCTLSLDEIPSKSWASAFVSDLQFWVDSTEKMSVHYHHGINKFRHWCFSFLTIQSNFSIFHEFLKYIHTKINNVPSSEVSFWLAYDPREAHGNQMQMETWFEESSGYTSLERSCYVRWKKKMSESTLAARLSLLFDKLSLAVCNPFSVRNVRATPNLSFIVYQWTFKRC